VRLDAEGHIGIDWNVSRQQPRRRDQRVAHRLLGNTQWELG
jgi:hypothetical protein